MVHLESRDGLHRLLYASKFGEAFPESFADREEEIGKIIRASIRRNRDDAITGLLLVHGGWFLQALEGPGEAVEGAYQRILLDPRHSNAAVLAFGPVPRRSFANWNMCARRLSQADDAILEDLHGHDPALWTAESALSLLKQVRDVQADTMTALT
jgi:hypothetical protein